MGRIIVASHVGATVMKSMVHVVSILAAAAFCVAAGAPQITEKLLTKGHSARPAQTTVDMVVIHYSSDVVANPDSPYDVDKVIKVFEDNDVGAHYLIDRDGKVYRLVKETDQAYHAGKGKLPWDPNRQDVLNRTSIGIELLAIGTESEMSGIVSPTVYKKIAKDHPAYIGYTEAQYSALKALIADIRTRYPKIENDRHHIIGHDEYAPDRKKDPGSLFKWDKIVP
jgi:N-acetyl-anhydromuramyl-L-alanine amidase AmpD